MAWLVPMDSSGFLVLYDTSIFTLALKLNPTLKRICVNALLLR